MTRSRTSPKPAEPGPSGGPAPLQRRVLATRDDAELAVAWSQGTFADPRYRLVLEIPELPELPQKRRHWIRHKRAADHWRLLIAALVNSPARPRAPLSRARVVCTRRSASQPDYGNLAASFKPVLDALTRSRWGGGRRRKRRYIQRADVLEDDNPRVIEERYRWEPARGGSGGIRIEIEEMIP